jgi:tRNA A-37 threonylcarbamoyl transferase component Bud32
MNSDNLVGQILGERYRIDELVGQGGVSVVYKGYDSKLKQVVAVKVFLAGLADDDRFQTRFEEEAPAVARLRHPNIVQVLDYGRDGDLYYMVQEFVPGETLKERLRRLGSAGKHLSVAEVIRYALQIGDAAGYAHRQGILHRDIRPANIRLDVHDQAILMDLGIVKISGGERHTANSAVVDTATYMAPEVIRGETPDPRSDVYSLGVTLYEMAGGRPPFEAGSAMTLLMMHLKDPVPDLREVRSDVPTALWAVLSRALAKDRDERYTSMADLGLALQGIGKPLQSSIAPDLQGTELDIAEVLVEPARPAIAVRGAGDATAARPGMAATNLETGPQAAAPAVATRLESSAQPAAAATKLETGPQPAAAATRLESSAQPAAAPEWVKTGPTPAASPQAAGPAPQPRERVGSLSPMPTARASKSGILRKWWVWAGAAILLAALGLGLTFALAGGSDEEPSFPEDAVALPAPGQGNATPTVTPTATLPPADQSTAMPGEGSGPASHESMPQAASPISVTITGVTLDPEGRYVADFQTFGLPEVLTTTHLHFFFNNVPFEKAGAPYEKNWITYFGLTPFTGYTAADRPSSASQLCVQAVNPNYTPILGTGSCAPLPDVALATSTQGIDGFFGPGTDYPVVARLQAGEKAMILGLSPDELWWNVANPANPVQNYWISTVDTQVTGDISKLPLVEGPPPGAVPPQLLSVEITGVSVNENNQYVTDFAVEGFTPAYPGTHIHFFFDTVTPDQVGIGGEANRRAYGGPSPFTSYSQDERPDQATQLCAVVANPDHSVVPGSSNCFPLPNLPTVEITGITLDADQLYVVDFVAKDFVPTYPGGTHIHFYFNIVTADQVGIGGEANRRSHGGPAPFTGYAAADRPENATQLCGVVANPDHTVIPNSGSCYTLPGLPTLEITGISLDAEGRYVTDFVNHGFTPQYPGGTHIHFYFNIYTADQVGIGGEANRRSFGSASPFSGYAAADRPEGATQLCGVVANPDHTVIPNSGSCYHLPDVLDVVITGITVDGQGRYVVEYVTYGFTTHWPGTHVHFFFDTVKPEDLGKKGGSTNFSHGGSSPYSGYSTADRPQGATQLCAIVALEDNTVLHDSAHCFLLP